MVVNGKSLLHLAPIKDMKFSKLTSGPVTYGLGEAGYDIRIKQDIVFYGPNYHITGSMLKGTRYRRDEEELTLGNFCLASAIEEFQMPPDLMGIVHDKSSWARHGLSVFNTIIEPGWHGFLTLELVYHGQQDLIIPAGSGIAQVVFHQTTEARAYTGRYQNQENKPVPPIKA